MSKTRILLVDDRPENLLVLEHLLSDLAQQLVKVTSGEEALRAVLAQEFAVILMDVQMQGMSGLETAKLIKERENSATTPIVFITAFSAPDSEIFESYGLGAVDYLVKPVVPQILRAKVKTFVDLFEKNQLLQAQAAHIEQANQALKQQLAEIKQLDRRLNESQALSQVQGQRLTEEEEARLAAEAAARRSDFLTRANAVLSSSLDYETTLRNVARMAVPTIADWCTVHIQEVDGTIRQLVVEHADPGKIQWAYELQQRYPPDVNAPRGVYQVIRTGKSELYSEFTDEFLVAVARDEEHLRLIREVGFSSAMIVPLIASEQILGAITFVAAESRNHYTQEDLQLAEGLAHHSALAVENARLYREIYRQRNQLQTTLISIGDAVIATDHQGYVTQINVVAEALTGWTYAEAFGKPINEVFHIVNETTRELVESPVAKVLRLGTIVGLANHTILIAKDGREIPIDDSGAPIRDAEGNIAGIVMVFRDITERKQAEDALAHSLAFHIRLETQLSTLITAAGNLLSTLEKRSVLSTIIQLAQQVMNADAYGVWRYFPESEMWHTIEMIGLSETFQASVADSFRNAMSFNSPIIASDVEQVPFLAGRLAAYRQEGIRATLIIPLFIHGAFSGSIVFYYRQVREFTDLEVRVATALANIAGAAIGNAELYEEQIQLRTEAQHSQKRWAFLAEVSSVLASSLDYEATLKGLADLTVPELADWYAVDIPNTQGDVDEIIVAHRDPQKVALAHELQQRFPFKLDNSDSRAQVFKTGKPILVPHVTEEMLKASGQPEERLHLTLQLEIVSIMIVPIIARSETFGIITFASGESGRHFQPEDLALALEVARRAGIAIDNARLYRQTQQALQLRNEFLSIASHELKTPVTSLRGFAQTTLRHFDKTAMPDLVRVKSSLQRIDDQASRLGRLTDQLLDISRIEAGRLALTRQATNINEVIQGLVGIRQATTAIHTLSVRAATPIVASVDPLRFEQVMINLIDNAIKYSPDGGDVLIEISQQDSEMFTIAVTDHGIGIPAEHLPRIFERFYQANSANYLGGMGLGLYISREIVSLHGGQLTLECPTEGGTRFIVTLPMTIDAKVP